MWQPEEAAHSWCHSTLGHFNENKNGRMSMPDHETHSRISVMSHPLYQHNVLGKPSEFQICIENIKLEEVIAFTQCSNKSLQHPLFCCTIWLTCRITLFAFILPSQSYKIIIKRLDKLLGRVMESLLRLISLPLISSS